MKIGLIIYSRTNNTLSVAEKLKESLLAKGHVVNLERITAVDENPNTKEKIVLNSIPDQSPYDYIILGAPVQAFSLSPIMKTYLAQIPGLGGKKVDCFVTQHFPKSWMGGKQAIKKMLGMIKQKDGIVEKTGVVNWTNKGREEQIADILARFSKS